MSLPTAVNALLPTILKSAAEQQEQPKEKFQLCMLSVPYAKACLLPLLHEVMDTPLADLHYVGGFADLWKNLPELLFLPQN